MRDTAERVFWGSLHHVVKGVIIRWSPAEC